MHSQYLFYQYHEWQNEINLMQDMSDLHVFENSLQIDYRSYQEVREVFIKYHKDCDDFKNLQLELQRVIELQRQQVEQIRSNLPLRQEAEDEINLVEHEGLTAKRIQQFHEFPADEQLVGDRCGVCLDDIEVGRSMMRLDCDGQHVFCRDCVESWFANRNTCPNCRHVFQ